MKLFKLFLFFAVIGRVNAQYTAIPDTAFEQELINQGIDTDSTINGHVLTSDVNTITSLIISDNNDIINLIGIQDFVMLDYLEISSCENLSSLNISNNLNLKSFICLLNTSLFSLNLSNNIALEHFSKL